MNSPNRPTKRATPTAIDDADFRVMLAIGDVFTRHNVDTEGAYRILRRTLKGLGPVPVQPPPRPRPVGSPPWGEP